MQESDSAVVLDRDVLREVTLSDENLMREIIAALIDDTSRQIPLLETAIREQDGPQCMRLAHYSKGACANVGAKAAVVVLAQMERQAARGDFSGCQSQLSMLAAEIDRLKAEAI